jgi:outer membrane protein OmpA-like peptidoglycan-associated protein
MRIVSNSPKALLALAMVAVPVTASLAQAQEQGQGLGQGEVLTTVYSPPPPPAAEMTKGPEIDGIISARNGNTLQVTGVDGTPNVIAISEETRIRASGGFLGLDKDDLGETALLNGLPVTIETLQWSGGLVASKIALKNKDLQTANMIRNGTEQRFNEHGVAIQQNAAATEALRGRMGDIDQYNIKGTTNVHFDTGRAALSTQARDTLCQTAAQAEAMENALLLVVGYTDATGPEEFNQQLSEKRAGSVINHLQQKCGWKPYRMLTPTGMAEADPLADNSTPQGKAQNRRVAVNILVSKAVEEL